MKRVILIGDSIRLGYEPTVRRLLADAADVWAPEENVEDSATLRRRLEDWVLCRPVDVVHLNCGLHDLKRNPPAGELQVPLAQYRQNLEDIFRRVRATGARLLWASITPVDDARHQAAKPFARHQADVLAFNAAAAEIAQRFGLPVDDLHATVQQAGPASILQPDGVHYTAPGSQRLGEAVAAFIRRHL